MERMLSMTGVDTLVRVYATVTAAEDEQMVGGGA
jgi:hypothetical protein